MDVLVLWFLVFLDALASSFLDFRGALASWLVAWSFLDFQDALASLVAWSFLDSQGSWSLGSLVASSFQGSKDFMCSQGFLAHLGW